MDSVPPDTHQDDQVIVAFASKDPNMTKLLYAMMSCAVVSVQSTEYSGSFNQGGYNSPRYDDYGEGYDGGYDSVPYGGYGGGNQHEGGYEKQGYDGYSGYGKDGYSGYGSGGPPYGSRNKNYRFKPYP